MIRNSFSKIKSNKINPALNNVPIFKFRRNLQYKPIETSNIIRIGHKMTQVIDKKRQKYLEKKIQEEKFSNSFRQSRRLLIACSNPNFNHYTGQAYKNFSERNFASYGWRNRRSAGQYFTINAISSHPSLIDNQKLKNEREEMIEFNDTFLNPLLIQILTKKIQFHQPTLIQFLGINKILLRQSHQLIVAETGGGKTLAYSLPIIECCVLMKKNLDKLNIKQANNQPKCIILVPTRELAFQVYQTFNILINFNDSLSAQNESEENWLENFKNLNVIIDLHKAQIKAKELVTGIQLNSFDQNQMKPIDVLITTPGQLEDRLANKTFNSAFLRHVVLDEADTLLDDSFSSTTLKCLNSLGMSFDLPNVELLLSHSNEENDSDKLEALRRDQFSISLEKKLKDPSVQLLFVSATVPRDLKNILNDLINSETSLNTISTSKINRLMLHVPQKFIRTNAARRTQQLIELIEKDLGKKNIQRTIMIFTYRTKTAIYVYKLLKEKNIECEILTKQLNNQDRSKVVDNFFNGKVRVLVCTDIASRGWDTLNVNHVINFEMPQFIADYLHRVGRVGRINAHKYSGSGAQVTNFIINRFEVDLVWNIERSLRLDTELHNINANVKRLYKYSYSNKDEIDNSQYIKKNDHLASQQNTQDNFNF